MDEAKQKIVMDFIRECQELGLSEKECVDLAARNLIGAVSASGYSTAKIEIDSLGAVEVEC